MQGTKNILILVCSTNSCTDFQKKPQSFIRTVWNRSFSMHDPVWINYLNRLSVGFSHFCHFSHICLHLNANSDKYFPTCIYQMSQTTSDIWKCPILKEPYKTFQSTDFYASLSSITAFKKKKPPKTVKNYFLFVLLVNF